MNLHARKELTLRGSHLIKGLHLEYCNIESNIVLVGPLEITQYTDMREKR